MVLFFLWAAIDTENRAENCFALRSRRRGTGVTRIASSGAHYRRARTRRRCWWMVARGIRGRSAGWAGRGWERVTFGRRNAVEQWFSIFKQRVKRFYRRWPHNVRAETALSWCEAFVAVYNLKRA